MITSFGKPVKYGTQNADLLGSEMIERATSDAPQVMGPCAAEGNQTIPRQGGEHVSTVDGARPAFH